MGEDFKKEARRRYLHYFRFWFIAIGILAASCIVGLFMKMTTSDITRMNNEAPVERVYDYADVLTDEEEEDLRLYIAATEEKLRMDIVILTINQSVEGWEAMEQYGYRSADWEQNMQDIADNFWDENQYGYNADFEGDGVLLLSNWYEGQGGEHLSTSGKAFREFDSYDIDYVLDRMGYYIESDPHMAYRMYVDAVSGVMGIEAEATTFSWGMVLLLPTIAAVIYACYHLYQRKAKDTTTARTYVEGGNPVFKNKSDMFIRKTVIRRHIQTNTGNGGRSGGGGGHRSSSGARHGGGSRRR